MPRLPRGGVSRRFDKLLLGEGGDATAGHVQRDYWVALSEHAGVLWIYQERLASEETAWYLHGVFA